jgi:hypothetical protein
MLVEFAAMTQDAFYVTLNKVYSFLNTFYGGFAEPGLQAGISDWQSAIDDNPLNHTMLGDMAELLGTEMAFSFLSTQQGNGTSAGVGFPFIPGIGVLTGNTAGSGSSSGGGGGASSGSGSGSSAISVSGSGSSSVGAGSAVGSGSSIGTGSGSGNNSAVGSTGLGTGSGTSFGMTQGTI